MINVKIRGRAKGEVQLPQEATVAELKAAIANALGVPVGTQKLLAGGRQLTDDASPVVAFGIADGKTVMLMQKPDEGAQKKIDAVVQHRQHVDRLDEIAAEISARDVEDYDGRSDKFAFEVTNQNGDVVQLPLEQRRNLTRGMIMHDKGRAELRQSEVADSVDAHARALAYFRKAYEALKSCDQAILSAVDNFAFLCLDMLWSLFNVQDFRNLDMWAELLAAVEFGFESAHGRNLERLFALKGLHCPERALYVRLHLLQGVYHVLTGSAHAKGLPTLMKAQEECRVLQQSPEAIHTLVVEFQSAGIELSAHVAARALRAANNSLDGARQYLQDRLDRQARIEAESRERSKMRKRRRKYGLTNDGSKIDMDRLQMLMNAGFDEREACQALKQSNNDIETALLAITFNRSAQNQRVDDTIHQLLSMGYDSTRAREAATAAAGDLTGALEFLTTEIDLEPTAAVAAAAPATLADEQVQHEGHPGEASQEFQNQEQPSQSNELQEMTGEESKSSSSESEEENPHANELLDGWDEDDEAYLDTTLQEEGHAIKMYLLIAQEQIPVVLQVL